MVYSDGLLTFFLFINFGFEPYVKSIGLLPISIPSLKQISHASSLQTWYFATRGKNDHFVFKRCAVQSGKTFDIETALRDLN
jgi:hypothetical protein